ncbi:DUF4192 domain-containing protein [Saccharopolyspora elongata]|nr:DUF4192 domain-containing protein [Saccharopolyspora elongata]
MDEFKPQVSISTPAEILAAVPHMLGFYPADSRVLLTLHDLETTPRFGVALRTDLPHPTEIREFAAQLIQGSLKPQRPNAVVAIVVSDEGHNHGAHQLSLEHSTTRDPANLPHAELVNILIETLQHADIHVGHALWTPGIRSAAPWRCYRDHDCSGSIPDPAASPLAASLALQGSVTFLSKDEIRTLVAPESDDAIADWSAKLDALHNGIEDRYSQDELRSDLRAVSEAIDSISNGMTLTEDELVRVLFALSDNLVRDIALGTALGNRARAAEKLWLALIRKAPVPEFGEVAVLLAVSAYARGDGALAGITLERLRQTQPDHHLGILLTKALHTGVSPTHLTAMMCATTQEALREVQELIGSTNPFVL